MKPPTADELLALWRVGSIPSTLGGHAPQHVRCRPMPGESEAQAKARFRRELEVEREWALDRRRSLSGGQVLAVRYDD
jgi:hypothetical protein